MDLRVPGISQRHGRSISRAVAFRTPRLWPVPNDRAAKIASLTEQPHSKRSLLASGFYSAERSVGDRSILARLPGYRADL